ncbi:MAG: hypothetical protein ACRC41_13375 [Sarcina sp.]
MKKIMIMALATIALTLGLNAILKNKTSVEAKEMKKNLELSVNNKKNDDTMWKLNVDDDGKQYLKFNNKEIREAWRYDEQGNLMSVDMEEYLNIINNSFNTGDLALSFDELKLGVFKDKEINVIKESKEPSNYRYVQTNSRSIYGEPIKITASIDGSEAGAEFIDENHTYISARYGGKALGNIRVKNAIALGVDFEWNNVVKSNNNAGKRCEIRAHTIGHLEFIPKLTYTKGSIYRDIYNAANIKIRTEELGEVEGVTPNKLKSGFADGVFVLKIFVD